MLGQLNFNLKLFKDTINGIGIDWDGNDLEINKNAYECVKNMNKKENFRTPKFPERSFIKEICLETVPGVKKIIISLYLN